ncbi:glycoside hydrolase family 97 protein [Candidatus Neomarinimicrobiota bacterium]
MIGRYKYIYLLLTSSVTLFFTCTGAGGSANQAVVYSPDGRITLQLKLADNNLAYSVDFKGEEIVAPSRLGLDFGAGVEVGQIEEITHMTHDDTWPQPWGEVAQVRDHYNGLSLTYTLAGEQPFKIALDLKAYDDGVALRYRFPAQAGLDSINITDELTEFSFTADHSAWWIPAYQYQRYEYLYTNTPISAIDTIHTPATFVTDEGLHLSIHEAALTDYASMTLAHTNGYTLKCDLAPWSDGIKVKSRAPLVTPWRTIQIAETAGDLITSNLILNLNEPNKLGDVSWVKPGKYVGIWWGMHIDEYTWSSGDKHGATTENTKRYIDFAAENGFDGVLVEGWNTGWDGNWVENGDLFSFTESYPDYDLQALTAYAAERGVRIIGHNETSTGILNYERQLDDAFTLYRKLGIKAIKTGYVGHSRGIKRIDPDTGALLGREWHYGQYMVNHYRKVVETAAKYQIVLDVHEPIKATGIRRTYPNMMTREGARGQEYNAWGENGGNPPEHTTILPFTRLLAGPFDFTPGIFELPLNQPHRPDNRMNTTLAKQLALYVVIYSPLHMAADLPENYVGHPAFQFIRDVPTDWEQTVVLNGAIGEYVSIARQERGTDNWFLGSITNEQPRSFKLPLSFLNDGTDYIAQVYADGSGASYRDNPAAYTINRYLVDRSTMLTVQLAAGGGQAISLFPVQGALPEDTPKYPALD